MNIEIDFKVTGNLFIEGEEIQGVRTTTWDGAYLIDTEALKELLSAKKRCMELEKSTSHIMSMITSPKNDTALKELKAENDALKAELQVLKSQPSVEEFKASLRKKSAETRGATKKRAFALTLVLSMKGLGTTEIAGVLREKGYGSSTANIARALKVSNDGDYERVLGIFRDFPEDFEGFTEDDLRAWFTARHEKLQKIAEVRENNRSKQTKGSEWGSDYGSRENRGI